ncbi:TonB-dependent receptor [Sphingobium sp. SCG-1]|uniref:TonB-dependent receptor n=1 Tax=Sphingobium sp. SCG-1 TaxID=2072936 RepID=UPI000CD6935B|nr:TonB-dependent receptor plug domain-containing protein [Sphingobium sp. SCG-1]AUW60431.1 TonB-dependent receptor [Sphingobium sp. SCG-1]
MIRFTSSFLALSSALLTAGPAFAQSPDADANSIAADGASSIIVTAKTTRSATALPQSEMQKILPGVSPLKAIQTLPGVLYITADPWGYNEQNAQIFIHGFAGNQLGYTMDGIPLGDQSYGNYNGLSPQRAVISENVGRVVVSTGAGDLATASNSNLGGTVETYSSDPLDTLGIQAAQTVGSYSTSRTYVRIDSGKFGPGDANSAYISAARQRARAWDFNGKQGGWQANAKFVHDSDIGKITLFFDYNDMTQPNEDATVFFKPSAGGTATPVQLYTPYTKPFFYPDFDAYRTSYLSGAGNSPTAEGSNYRNYYSDAQRTDYLGYLRYDARISDNINWSTTGYYHHNDGAGVVAGPLGQSITTAQAYLDPAYATLPANCRFTANNNGIRPAACTALTSAQATAAGAALVAATGGSGLITRTTEYRIDRGGVISALSIDIGTHKIELGGWFEHNSTTQWRRWYGVDVANPQSSTPYIRPLDVADPLFTQYQGEAKINNLQLHIQDTWQVTQKLLVQAGFKTSAQWADGRYPVQPRVGSLGGTTALPEGKINTKRWFLPAIGATYDFNGHEQVYFNVQKNLRQYQAYLAGGGGPWFTGSQAAFDAFADEGKPESSWTYEAGLRTRRTFGGGIGFDAQVNYYHVEFKNRLLAIPTNPGGIAGSGITGGTSTLVNVGDVKTDGVDAAFTLRVGQTFSLYNAISYNLSKYQNDYTSTALGIGAASDTCIGGYLVVGGIVPTCGKQLPGTPKWMNKTVATLSVDPFEVQLIGDYVGRRFSTFTNDASVKSYFLTSLRVAGRVPDGVLPLRKVELALNVTNLTDKKGISTLSIGSATNSYSAYPIAPRQWFLTLSAAY